LAEVFAGGVSTSTTGCPEPLDASRPPNLVSPSRCAAENSFSFPSLRVSKGSVAQGLGCVKNHPFRLPEGNPGGAAHAAQQLAEAHADVALARSSNRYDSFDWWRTRSLRSGF
jgi:hypothetical protein